MDGQWLAHIVLCTALACAPAGTYGPEPDGSGYFESKDQCELWAFHYVEALPPGMWIRNFKCQLKGTWK